MLGADLTCSLDHRYLQLVRPYLDTAERDKGQVATDEPLLDGRELRRVVLDVDVDVLQLADPLAVAIDQHLAVPLGDVPFRVLLMLGHRCRLP